MLLYPATLSVEMTKALRYGYKYCAASTVETVVCASSSDISLSNFTTAIWQALKINLSFLCSFTKMENLNSLLFTELTSTADSIFIVNSSPVSLGSAVGVKLKLSTHILDKLNFIPYPSVLCNVEIGGFNREFFRAYTE